MSESRPWYEGLAEHADYSEWDGQTYKHLDDPVKIGTPEEFTKEQAFDDSGLTFLVPLKQKHLDALQAGKVLTFGVREYTIALVMAIKDA